MYTSRSDENLRDGRDGKGAFGRLYRAMDSGDVGEIRYHILNDTEQSVRTGALSFLPKAVENAARNGESENAHRHLLELEERGVDPRILQDARARLAKYGETDEQLAAARIERIIDETRELMQNPPKGWKPPDKHNIVPPRTLRKPPKQRS